MRTSTGPGAAPVRRHRTGRTAVGVIGTLFAVAALAGCSPAPAGLIGIARNAAGALVVVTDACGEELDFVALTRTIDGGPTGTLANGRLLYDETTPSRIRLTDDQRQLTTIGPISELRGGASYSIGAWNDRQSFSAPSIAFRAEDLAGLNVGQVYTRRPLTPPTGQNGEPSGAPSWTVDRWLAASCPDKR